MAYEFKSEPLNKDEATLIANACESGFERLVVWTLLDTALRVDELATLTREQIDWQGKRVTIYGKGGPYGQKKKKRVVPLSPRARALLEAHFALNDTFGFHKRTLQRTVKTVAVRSGITKPITAHILRHTWATLALQDGLSLTAVQRILGHERLTTTQIYLNQSNEDAVQEYFYKMERAR